MRAIPQMTSTVLVLLFVAGARPAPAAERRGPLRVLVTNDDGVGAAGIDALVRALVALPDVAVSVFAPATNQSGTGGNITTGPVSVMSATTASGFPAVAVAGFPADAALFGILQGLPAPPDLVVSGINAGQNVADLATISGTVGAALAAVRLGIPAIATSQGLAFPISYDTQAAYVAELVDRFRRSRAFRRLMLPQKSAHAAMLLNVNFPTCLTGTLRGVRVVKLGRLAVPVGYQLVQDMGTSATWQIQQQSFGIGSTNCGSTSGPPTTDLDALNTGFGSVTPLASDLTWSGDLGRFSSLER
jgi:5'-nucleotidase